MASTDPVLKLGDGFPQFNMHQATKVKELQRLLIGWGYKITETGHFDWPTDQALLHFQRSFRDPMFMMPNLLVDAKTGPSVWKALREKARPIGSSFSVGLDAVPFIHQFDSLHVASAGQDACFEAAKTMLRAVGVRDLGSDKRIQIITKETWKSSGKERTLTVDETALTTGLAYIDAQLLLGNPVMVGVSYANLAHNVDKLTEHFVVITKKQSEGVYLFNDPATTKRADGVDQTFTKDAAQKTLIKAGNLTSGYAFQREYAMSMVRKGSS
jgi:hypothetical protein